MVSSSYVIQSTSIHYLQIGYSNLTLGNHNYVPSCPILNWSYISLPHPTRPSYHIHLVPSYPNDMGHMHWCSQYCPCPMIFRVKAVMMFHAPSFSQQFSINVPSFVYHVPSMFHHFPTDFGGLNTQWRFSRATVGSPGPLVAPLRPVASGRSRYSVSASAGADAVSRSGAAWLVNQGILRVI